MNEPVVSEQVKKDLRVSTALTFLSIVLVIINIVGGTAFWLSLPEKLKEAKTELADHEQRLRALEADRGLLQRIDERTKSIQDDVKQIHQDFSFSARATPK